MRVRVLGVDGSGAKMAGRKEGLLFHVDLDRSRLICVEPVDEKDSAKVRRHVQKVMRQVGDKQLIGTKTRRKIRQDDRIYRDFILASFGVPSKAGSATLSKPLFDASIYRSSVLSRRGIENAPFVKLAKNGLLISHGIILTGIEGLVFY